MASKQYHVMMLPWLAFGHMLPFLELSKQLAARGIQVSFISTPRNVQRLPAIPPNLADKIKYVEIPLPSVDGLPKYCEATIDLQPDQIQYLSKAYDMLKVPFESLVHNESPDLILFDFVPFWIPEVAAKFSIPSAFFSVFSAAVLAFTVPPVEPSQRTKAEDLMVPPNWFPFPSLVAYSAAQAATMFQHLNFPDISGKSIGQRFTATLEGCDFVAVRSCREFEGAYLNLLEELYQKPVIPVGLLPPNIVENKPHHPNDSNWSTTFKWLDKQQPKSVVFVGFGSEYKMPIEQIHELAYGIELSGLPFIWILRKPEELDDSDLLPTGFLARTSDRGIVNLGWAPQQELLAHQAIGGCFFHSGWGSIIESLSFGHLQILMPMIYDQDLNAKLLVEKGIGFEVQKNEDGSFNRHVVAKSMTLVMVEQAGEPLRHKAPQMQTIFADQDLHDDYVSKFVQILGNFKKKEH